MKILIKVGSNIVASKKGLRQERIEELSEEIARIHSGDVDVVLVSSGAIAAGLSKLGLKRPPKDIMHKQAAAAIGQSSLIWAYERAFARYNKKVAQVLLTRDAFQDRQRYLNAKNTLTTLMSYRIIPVINENDTVAVDEIRFGDNDQLAALVAGMLSVDRLIILSDVEGLYTDDPKRNPRARLIKKVEEITPDIERIAGIGSELGTGGMYSKVLAAKKAVSFGIRVHIINGKSRGLIERVLQGEQIGTEFTPKGERIGARKGWIAFGLRARGQIIVDDGAKEAILRKGKSLLPSGIIDTRGVFHQGDAVYCVDRKGKAFAKGLVNYSSEDIEKIKGHHSREIEQILGYEYSEEVIHRDNLVLIG